MILWEYCRNIQLPLAEKNCYENEIELLFVENYMLTCSTIDLEKGNYITSDISCILRSVFISGTVS